MYIKHALNNGTVFVESKYTAPVAMWWTDGGTQN